MSFFMNVYFDLQSEVRTEGGKIPWTSLREYAIIYGFSPSDFAWFQDIIRTLENHAFKRAKQKTIINDGDTGKFQQKNKNSG